LEQHGIRRDQVDHWLMHPGGRKVINRVQRSLGLTDEQVERSRRILRSYGNMSSPTVLFVLRDLLEQGIAKKGDRAVLTALGPGFAAEAALLEW
jgi:alkylresorcinol/alkylpyrone synthase